MLLEWLLITCIIKSLGLRKYSPTTTEYFLRPFLVYKMKVYIYKITNNINGKIYIGKHIDRSETGFDNYMGSGIIIKNAQKKYGINNFTKEILEECSKENVNEREIFWINELQSTKSKIGYNVTKGGEGGDTFTNNPKAEILREQISKRLKGKNNPNYGKHHDLEHKQQICEANTGLIYWNNGKINKRSKSCPGEGWVKGILVSQESAELRSKTHKGIESAFKGKHHTTEARLQLSKAHKGLLKGTNNPAAKSIEIISPTGEIFNIKGTLKLFCQEHKLSYTMARKYIDQGPCPNSKFTNNKNIFAKNTVNWTFNTVKK